MVPRTSPSGMLILSYFITHRKLFFETNHVFGAYSGETVEGQCGRHCEGGPTDTIGIFEFDTRTNKVVGTHSSAGSAAAAATFTSPDGEHIVMFGMNGGESVQILQANANGQKSSLVYDIALDFNITNVEDFPVFEDFAFVKHHNLNLFVLSSSNENKVAIVDLTGSSPKTDYVTFKNEPFEGRARTRQVEWVYGTDYVWVSGPSDQNAAYVIDVKNKVHKKTLDVNTGALRSVVNFDFLGLSNQLDHHFNRGSGSSSPGSSSGGGYYYSSAESSNLRSNDSDSDRNGLSIAAVVLSTIAIVAVFVNLAMTAARTNKTPAEKETIHPSKMEEQSLAVPSVN